MDTEGLLKAGLLSTPRYLPVWYRYDKLGSGYNDRCLSDNAYYYFYNSEVSVLKERCQEIVNEVASPCVLVEMGSGNSEKSRLFIDLILAKQSKLTYMPVDISIGKELYLHTTTEIKTAISLSLTVNLREKREFLEETANCLAKDYGDCLEVKPIPGDYGVGIAKLSEKKGRKLILWLGGGCQNQPYDVQVDTIRSLSLTMSEEDRLLITLDITQDKTATESAYLDPTGISAPLYLNTLWRLNRDYGANIDTDNFQLEARFEQRTEDDRLSGVVLTAISKCSQLIDIPGLDLNFSLSEGEEIVLHEGERLSCKYTEAQIRTFVSKGGQKLHKFWKDSKDHAALCFIGK